MIYKRYFLSQLRYISAKNNIRYIKVDCKNRMENTKVRLRERLSSAVLPTHYSLLLNPNFKTGLFEGRVAIDISVKEEQNNLVLNTKFLEINDVKLMKGDIELSIAKYLEVLSLEQLLIHLNQNLSPGSYQLNIKFSGNLTRKIVGLYISHLKNVGSMVASKFQPTYARQAFPCFDEPEFKATYDISLVKPTDYIALSNMNEISKKFGPETNTDVVTFATSVPMSTYLACFVICNFDFKETVINTNGTGTDFMLRAFAQKDQTHKIDFALDIGKRATEFYIQYYEVPFPLPKLDMIAIPDYVSGATEHWGLITYRETSFLVDEAVASSQNKISVANTIAHELAHMWFGNLVTMKWWDEVWLNEGFASYMQVKCLNALEPSWTMLDQFLIKTLHRVFETDSKISSHPIVQTVETPDEITAIFDAISYNKGASVLRMLEGFIGEENFRKGVSDYLEKYKFTNTITQDLLSCLDTYFKKENPNLNLTHIMDTWTKQMGFPVLDVKRGDRNTYVLTQSQFLINPKAKPKEISKFGYRWFIPITYKTSKGVKEDIVWFSNEDDNVILSLEEDEKWIKINNNQVGYYRVNYSEDMWNQLLEQLKLKSKLLTISDRAHLLNDAFALAEAGSIPYVVALNMSTYLNSETDYVPWETAANIFTQMTDRLQNTLAYDDLLEYIQQLIRPLYMTQDWDKSHLPVIEGLLRTRVLSLATLCQLPEAQEKVRSMFLTWLNSRKEDRVQLDTDLRATIYYAGMKSATLEEWEKLWQIYLKEEDVQEQAKLRSALAAPRDPAILKRFLLLAWDEKNIRTQDYLTVLNSISRNPSGLSLVWDSIRSSWLDLVDRFTLNSRYLGSTVGYVMSQFNTELKLEEMENFFKQYPEAGAGESHRKEAIENVRNNIKWMDEHQSTVAEWLKKQIQKESKS